MPVQTNTALTRLTTLVKTAEVIPPASTLRFYPNPAGDEIRLQVEGIEDIQSGTVTVYDTHGRLKTVQEMSGNSIRLDLRAWTPGRYYALWQRGGKAAGGWLVKVGN